MHSGAGVLFLVQFTVNTYGQPSQDDSCVLLIWHCSVPIKISIVDCEAYRTKTLANYEVGIDFKCAASKAFCSSDVV